MEKIRYRLIYNRKKVLNKQGCALIQIEAKLNKRNIYFTTDVYLQPEYWDADNSMVVNHPHAASLNAFLFEKILHLQNIELSFWKRDIQPTLALLRDSIQKKTPTNETFLKFARHSVVTSDKKPKTKKNLLTTIHMLEIFRSGIDFPDLTYSFVKDFERFLKNRGNSTNTVAKHLRQLRTLINESINNGYISPDAYPFRKFKIKQEHTTHRFLTPNELKKMETLKVEKEREQHVLDAFLFCCYSGIRYSDFCNLKTSNIVIVNKSRWLFLKMQKTELDIKLPLELMFEGKALTLIDKYKSIEQFAHIPFNSETNQIIAALGNKAGIKKHLTFHTSRHTCATLLIYQGVALTTVQKILGHTSIKTTQIYSEILSDTIVKDLKSIKRKK